MPDSNNFPYGMFLICRPDERPGGRIGNKRRLRLRLDAAQYYQDVKDSRDCYTGLNLVVRRHAKENNFKPILETIRDLLNAPGGGNLTRRGGDKVAAEQASHHDVPHWLHDVFLGYGSPSAAHYRYVQYDSLLPVFSGVVVVVYIVRVISLMIITHTGTSLNGIRPPFTMWIQFYWNYRIKR